MKVGREEVVGVWLAAERYAKLDFDALDRQYAGQANYLAGELKKIPGLQVSHAPHDRTRRVHRVVVDWDQSTLKISVNECEKRLMEGDPRIAVLRHKGAIMFTLFMNDPGDEKIVARRMREIFGSSRKG